MSKSDGSKAIERPLASLPAIVRNLVLDRIDSLARYEPVIGIMGKTGAGKAAYVMHYFKVIAHQLAMLVHVHVMFYDFAFELGNTH